MDKPCTEIYSTGLNPKKKNGLMKKQSISFMNYCPYVFIVLYYIIV